MPPSFACGRALKPTRRSSKSSRSLHPQLRSELEAAESLEEIEVPRHTNKHCLKVCGHASGADGLKEIAVPCDEMHLAIEIIPEYLRLLNLILRTQLIVLSCVAVAQVACRDIQTLGRVHRSSNRIGITAIKNQQS